MPYNIMQLSVLFIEELFNVIYYVKFKKLSMKVYLLRVLFFLWKIISNSSLNGANYASFPKTIVFSVIIDSILQL